MLAKTDGYLLIMGAIMVPGYSLGLNLPRIRSPNTKKASGIGMRPRAINPRRVFPHPSPSALYISRPPRGRSAPRRDLRTAIAAVTDAA